MSEVTEKEIGLLEKMWREYVMQFKNEDCEVYKDDHEIYLSLRRLIEEQEAWAEEAGDMIKFFGIHLPLRVKILLERLRGFDKEADDEEEK
jgi:hypothetical protein